MDAALPYEMNAAGKCEPGARLHPTAAFERPARAKNRTHSARFCLEKLNDFRYMHTKDEQQQHRSRPFPGFKVPITR
ncbi:MULTISPECIES: hypothetical protein [Aeromonas]|uniref:hypothetical protein n=1 Tax=Aeromonas TaxID=642 RepID=UPI00191EDEC8|nr:MULTISPECIES: hypothetical protein [Aeromonas]MBL0509815.1 hypothetical protein [Aeromonas caviae]